MFFHLAPKTPLQPQPSDRVIFKQEMKDIEVGEGDVATFDVLIDGADLEVDWYRDDELLEDAGRIIIEDPHPESDDNLYSLTIENCGPKDSGMKCPFTGITGWWHSACAWYLDVWR